MMSQGARRGLDQIGGKANSCRVYATHGFDLEWQTLGVPKAPSKVIPILMVIVVKPGVCSRLGMQWQ